MTANILVVDDDDHMRIALKEALSSAGYGVALAQDGEKAREVLVRQRYDLVITDVKMPKISGIDLLKYIKEESPLLPIILITAFGTIQDAVRVIKEGAFDYIEKPFSIDALYSTVKRALGTNGTRIVCTSQAMRDVLISAERVAQSDATVLIVGESGVGKELVARYIHDRSERNEKPYVPVNCAALPENLLESELFGHERGAFTGAHARKPGKFEIADGGTILLDEVTEMDQRLQAKLLRVLQEKEIEVIGSRYPKKVDVKVIAATNRDITKYVEEGKFREDLYYRLNVFPVVVPPLRERKEDIPELVAYLLKKHTKGKDVRIEQDALEFLMDQPWKGNVRELENTIARAAIISNYTVITIKALQEIHTRNNNVKVGSVKEMERRLIMEALRSVNGNKTRAATILGITARTLRNKMKEYRDMGLAISTSN